MDTNSPQDLDRVVKTLMSEIEDRFRYYVQEVFQYDEELPLISFYISGTRGNERCTIDLCYNDSRCLKATIHGRVYIDGSTIINYIEAADANMSSSRFIEHAALSLAYTHFSRKGMVIESSILLFLLESVGVFFDLKIDFYGKHHANAVMMFKYAGKDYEIRLYELKSDNHYILSGQCTCDDQKSGVIDYNTPEIRKDVTLLNIMELSEQLSHLYDMIRIVSKIFTPIKSV